MQKCLISKWIYLILIAFVTIILIGCDWLGQNFLGSPPLAYLRVKVERRTSDNNIVFKIDTKFKFGGRGRVRDMIGRFSVYQEHKLMWALMANRSIKIDTIIYGINPTPDYFEEEVAAKPLEKNVLYSTTGHHTPYYFKIVDDSKWGTIILQGDKPDNLKDLDH